jgi:starvation-inducible DNA-binding protein
MKHDRSSLESGHRRAPAAAEPARPEKEAGAREARRSEMAGLLNALLADEVLLTVKTLNYHWNVRGMQFHSLHAFLEEHYRTLLGIADDVAERIRTIGHRPLGSMAEFLKAGRLREHAGEPPDPKRMLSDLAADHAEILERLRQDVDVVEDRYDDAGTCNFLTDLLEKQEKLAWMVRTHLELDVH